MTWSIPLNPLRALQMAGQRQELSEAEKQLLLSLKIKVIISDGEAITGT